MALELHWPATLAGARDAVRDRLARGAVHVTGGAQTGASLELGSAEVTVGAHLDNDLVLLADGLDGGHARIAFADVLGRRLWVEALGAPVTLDERTLIEAGYGVEVPLPADLTVGRATLRVESAHRLPGATARRGVAVAALVAGVALLAGVPWSNGRALPLATPRQSTVMLSEAVPRPVEAAEKIRRMVADAGLSDQVNVLRTGADGVALSGRIDRALLPAWRSVVMKIDADADPVTVSNTVQIAEDEVKPPQIRSVWFGVNPKVMLADGRFLAAGDTTPDGWTVADISSDAVTLKNQSHAPVRVAF